MKEQTLSVKAIENGTVIDHIPAGEGLNILHYFALDQLQKCITVGFNLKSGTQNYKDLIKIEDVFFTEENIQQIAFFAPQCTINIIKNFEVIQKITPTYPDQVVGIFKCPNMNCASHGEPVKSHFYVKNKNNKTKLKCHYCEKIYPFEWVHK
ncbi:aspartate carbamoyltransferase regulatory subunit [Neisseriaceae bacterium PsAf]|nr:aspartate carbamoyltransferase regulatory subunit [Neisseriaceae bacterium PsAf]MCV2503623.1 aspartate carbamoyltransferase regulatory subunit [Neisseriaceae bacterium]